MGQIKAKLGEANLGALSIKLKGLDDKWSNISIAFNERLARLQSMVKNNEERINLIVGKDREELEHLDRLKGVSREMHNTTKELIRIVRSDFNKIVDEYRIKEHIQCIDEASNEEIGEFLCGRKDD